MRMKRKTADVLSPKQTVDIATLLISQAKTSKKEGLAKVRENKVSQALQAFAVAVHKLEQVDPHLLARNQDSCVSII